MTKDICDGLVVSLFRAHPDRFIVGHTFDVSDDSEPVYTFPDSDEGIFIDTRCRCGTTATVLSGDPAGETVDLVVVEHAATCSWLLGASRGAA
jgi:hypothetical protein